MQDTELPSGETSQRLTPQFHLAMYKLSAVDVTPSVELAAFFGERGDGCSGPGQPGAAGGAPPAGGAGTGAGEAAGDRAGAAPGAGERAGGLSPLADAALRQARAGAPGAAPAAGPTSMVNELVAADAANIRKES